MSGRDQVANVDVFLILRDREGRLLLGLRAVHLWAGGQWNVVSGKADVGEDVVTAVIREAHEEAGLVLTGSDLTPAAAVHYRNRNGQPRVGFAFHARHDPDRHGAAVNTEPHKCDALGWYDPDDLPQPLERYTATMLEVSASPVPIAVAGWPGRRPLPVVAQPDGHRSGDPA
jgi:8-oxo-dGTP pyrophosphatase MutT (NUDIX family)